MASSVHPDRHSPRSHFRFPLIVKTSNNPFGRSGNDHGRGHALQRPEKALSLARIVKSCTNVLEVTSGRYRNVSRGGLALV